MKLVGGNDFSRKKNLSEMIRKFAEIQGSWRKQKKKKGKAYVVETCCHHIKFFVLSTYIIMYH